MKRPSANTAFTLFRGTLAIVIFVESVLTVFHSLHSTTQSHLGTILPWFAGVEALAAVMILLPKTTRIGGVILLVIFLVAIVLHGPAEQMPLFVYAAGVILIMARGDSHDRSSNNAIKASSKEGQEA